MPDAPSPAVADLLAAAVRTVGGTDRPGQIEMAEAVAHALASGEHLLVQAGTGTGKSLAYLTAALHAANSGNGPVVVATATLALQSQLVRRDLPLVVSAMAPLLGRPPTYAVLKGRANYLCKHRLLAGPSTRTEEAHSPAVMFEMPGESLPMPSVAESAFARLVAWAETTPTGERDDLPSGVEDTIWRAVSVSARQCLGATRCPVGTECFAERARQRAREVDIVVTNHAMLALDVLTDAQLVPDHSLLVVDEGHELVDRATAAATQSLAPAAMARTAARFRRAGGGVRGGSQGPANPREDAADALEGALVLLEAVLGESQPGRIDRWPEALAAALTAVRDGASRAMSASGDSGASDAQQMREVRASLTEVRDTAVRLLSESDWDIRWCEQDSRGTTSVHVAPLSVSGLLRKALFDDRTVVVTSATLSIGGTFDAVARSLGLATSAAVVNPGPPDEGEDAPPPRWRGLDVGSPFDYARQGILYVPKHLPSPGRNGIDAAVIDELCDLVIAAGGRTLGLFSSARAAQQASEQLRQRVDYEILCQGDGATADLVRRFAADPETCLCGTLSLWQGIDVPGESCSLVVVDRIPFPRPDDPVASARREARDKAGGAGFLDVYVSEAATLLAQGTGRLIRSTSDRGVVAVLDSRLATARYASFLRAGLPPFWWTTDPGVARRSLRNLRASQV